jgi:hypothetical protein
MNAFTKWGEYLISLSFDQKNIPAFSTFLERRIRSAGCEPHAYSGHSFLFFIPYDRMTKSLINHDSISFLYFSIQTFARSSKREREL